MNRVIGIAPTLFAPATDGPWLFGRRTDVLAFGGSALCSFALLALGHALGIADGDAPPWIWLGCIVAVDVAHVWSTAFRVYLVPGEVRARPLLYLGMPLVCYALGVLVHAFSALAFWRVLAYVAVFHFVRQQYGWVSLYRRRAGERDPLDRVIDTAAIYGATLYPLLWWHTRLPRSYVWFTANDFVEGLAPALADALLPAYWGLLAAFCARQLWLALSGREPNAGKILVVLTTWAAWHVGIMVYDSDYAFTVTNVLIHGVPYLVLTYRYGRMRAERRDGGRLLGALMRGGAAVFLVVIAGAALSEEALWDRMVWHEHGWLFGEGGELSNALLTFLVPLLALPQAVHYALDGFIWRVRAQNPALVDEFAHGPTTN